MIANPRAVTEKKNYMAPKWSPDGLDLLVSGPKYTGLYLVSADGSEIRRISDEAGIGFRARFSPAGSKIIYEKDGETIVLDLSGEEVEVSEEDLAMENPLLAEEDDIIYKDPESGETTRLTDGGDAYFDPELSPEGDKALYEGLSTGLHVKDLSTGEVVNIGQGSDAQWTPDGDGVVYSFTQDDGHELIGGDVYYAYADGSGVFNLTNTPDVIELNPTISPDGTQITYEVDGQVFTADLLMVAD